MFTNCTQCCVVRSTPFFSVRFTLPELSRKPWFFFPAQTQKRQLMDGNYSPNFYKTCWFRIACCPFNGWGSGDGGLQQVPGGATQQQTGLLGQHWGSCGVGRPNELVRKSSFVMGMELENAEAVTEKRIRGKLIAIMDNPSHPLCAQLRQLRSTFSHEPQSGREALLFRQPSDCTTPQRPPSKSPIWKLKRTIKMYIFILHQSLLCTVLVVL